MAERLKLSVDQGEATMVLSMFSQAEVELARQNRADTTWQCPLVE